jgi:hypothetical protein
LNASGVRVPPAIRERFLNRSTHARPVSIGQRIEVAGDTQVDGHTVPPCEIADLPLERRLQAKIIKHAGPQT